jgi:hypothetical protein
MTSHADGLQCGVPPNAHYKLKVHCCEAKHRNLNISLLPAPSVTKVAMSIRYDLLSVFSVNMKKKFDKDEYVARLAKEKFS